MILIFVFQVVSKLYPSILWALLFFFMLLILGIDSQFCCAESLITGLVDNWAPYLRPRRLMFTTFLLIFMFFLGLPMITQVRNYFIFKKGSHNPAFFDHELRREVLKLTMLSIYSDIEIFFCLIL